MLSKILVTDPSKRYKLSDIRAHPWYKQGQAVASESETKPIKKSLPSPPRKASELLSSSPTASAPAPTPPGMY